MLAAYGFFDLFTSIRRMEADEAEATIAVAQRIGIAAVGMYAAYRLLRWL